MAEDTIRYNYTNATKQVRSYEISIWTLQDRFLSVLKRADQDYRGQIQDPEMTLRDDGTEELSFTIPKYYYVGANRIENPLWLHLEYQPIEANMHKLKVIFNKGTNDEKIFEFLVTSVAHDHTKDEVDLTVKAEGLAFHELGKIGYRVSFSKETYETEVDNYYDKKLAGATVAENEPQQNIQYWNDLIFKDTDGNWKGNWKYEVHMDWSAYSNIGERKADNKVYEDEYTSSWHLDGNELKPRSVEPAREKWRSVEISESNLYNITQTIAETFGVFCRYEYKHDDNYQLLALDEDGTPARTVIYYNNYYQDAQGHIDITYPYSSSGITRTVDSSEVITKMYIQEVEEGDDTINIMDVEANKSKEDYLLNFEYLHDIQAITDEQYAEIPKYEAAMREKNDQIIRLREHINAIKNQLVEINASITTLNNSIDEANKQYDEAEALKNGITGGSDFIDITNGILTVIEDPTGVMGSYVNTQRWPGLIKETISLYEENNYTSTNGSQYSSPIGSFVVVYDTDNLNIIRLTNLVRTSKQDSQIYITGKYNPTLYYEQLMNKWANRKAQDQDELNRLEAEKARLEAYLSGAEEGFETIPTAVVTDVDGNNEIITLTGKYITTVIGEGRIMNETMAAQFDINSNQDDPWEEYDKEHNNPHLEYRLQEALKQKADLFNKFEKMMGPAMREGYWQPEDMHNYGDRYNDHFTLNVLNGTNSNGPETAYLDVVWDDEKYYDNETPIIYEVSIDKSKDEHLAVDLSGIKNQEFIDNLKDLCFIYADPSTLVTIKQLRDKRTSSAETEKEERKINPEALDIITNGIDHLYDWVEKKHRHLDIGNDLTPGQLDNGYSHDELLAMYNAINSNCEWLVGMAINVEDWCYFAHRNPANGDTEENRTQLYAFGWSDSEDINRRSDEHACSNDASLVTRAGHEHLLEFLNKTKLIVKLIDELINTEERYKIRGYENRQEALRERRPIIDNMTTNIQMYYLPKIENQEWIVEQIAALSKNIYRVYRLGAGCELGWIKKYPNYPNTNGAYIKPALIVTGASELPDPVIDYILTGVYTTNDSLNVIDEKYESVSIDLKETNVGDSDIPLAPHIGIYDPQVNQDGTEITRVHKSWLEAWNDQNSDFFICGHRDNVTMTQDKDSGISRWPTWEEYSLKRVYPRLFFKTIKLKDYSSTLKISVNNTLLKNNEDYTIVSDDRTQELQDPRRGYYLTFKPETLFSKCIIENGTLVGNIPMELVYIISNTDVAIYLDAIKVMKENSKPKVEYQVDLSILNPEFVHTAYNRLNQIVHINDNDLKLEDVAGYISSVTLKLDKFWEDTVEIKNYETKFEDLFSTIVAQSEAMKKSSGGLKSALQAFTSTGLIDGDVLQDSLFNKEDINFQFNNGSLTIDNTNGIWGRSISKDGVEGVVAFRGGGIFTSNKKDENDNWIWNTGIVPSGINASLITSGQLDTNRIKIYAGDEVRFQLNGQGLFAYKPFIVDPELSIQSIWQESADSQNPPQNGVDSRQYIKYDSEGLFLIAKKGTWYKTGKELKMTIGSTSNPETIFVHEYAQTEIPEIKRVEVSWDGFILRNWQGDKVFYADPDTGNLTLQGRVEAKSGDIGGWELTEHELRSEGGIRLLSGPKAEDAGIILNPSFISSDVRTDEHGLTYYPYIDQNDRIIYLQGIATYTGTLAAGAKYYLDDTQEYFVSPKYQKREVVEATQNQRVDDDNEVGGETAENDYTLTLESDSQVSSYVTKIYVMLSDDPAAYALYGEQQEKIEYANGENALDTDKGIEPTWYYKLRTSYSNYKQYVTIVSKPILQEYTVSNPLTVSPKGAKDITFSVKASDGTVLIKKGTIANFSVLGDALSNGTLDQTNLNLNNIVQPVNDEKITLGKLIYKVESTNTGLVFRRLDGTTINFNYASLEGFQNALNDASKINLSLVIDSNGNVTATAVNGLGGEAEPISKVISGVHIVKAIAKNSVNYVEREASFDGSVPSSSGSGGSSGSSGGICQQCEASCFKECAKNCAGGCKNNGCEGGCYASCTSECAQHCSGTCSIDCSNGCKDTCGTGCTGTCYSGCKNGCKQQCVEGCKNNCGTTANKNAVGPRPSTK